MRGVENHRNKLAHDGQGAHIDHQIVVAETRSALGDENFVVARGAAFLHDMPHIGGRHELALLDIDHALRHGRGHDQIGLAAQECRNLQDVRDFRHLGDVGGFVHVGKNRHVHFIFHFFQDAQTFHQSRAAIAANGSAIGLVVGRLEDERKIQRTRDALDHFRHEERVLLALDDARPGNQKEIPGADSDIVDLKGSGHV